MTAAEWGPSGDPGAMLRHMEEEGWRRIVALLAKQIYDARELPAGTLDLQRLCVFADALEEAGVEAELVEHLRGQGPHVRGCWCVDALTGRE